MNLCTTYIILVKQIYNLIEMALFGNKKSEEEIIEETLADNNVFEGVNCNVIFPDTELRISAHDGLTKGVATLTLGIVGWAATSGISQKEKNRVLDTVFQIVEKGIVFKKATKEGKDLRIPYDNIVKIKSGDVQNHFIIILLENQEVHVRIINIKSDSVNGSRYLKNHIINIINERACGAQYEEAGWGLEHSTAEPQESKQEGESLMDELERLGNMYEKGLLTDDEFSAMKKKLIEE